MKGLRSRRPSSRLSPALGAFAPPLMALGLLWVLLLAPAPASADGTPPVVVAVDTSRSLTPEDLDRINGTLKAVVAQLPEEQPVGLLAFDDEPRWVVPLPGTPGAVVRELDRLRTRGDFTLLHDALVTAVRALPGGGVVLVATDGRDENSATTVEDVTALARERGVRILTLRTGRLDGSRRLRRLSLLTEGEYLERGPPSRVSEAVATALEATAEAESTPPVAPEDSTPTEPSESDRAEATAGETRGGRAVVPDGGPGRIDWWLWGAGGLILLVLAGAVFAVVARRRRRSGADFCPRCGTERAPGESCPHCRELELQQRLRGSPVAHLEDTAELALEDLEEEPQETPPGVLEKTRVLMEHHAVTVREPGERPRTYLLRREQAFAIGRDPDQNTLTVSDPSLSARHLKIVPAEGRFYAVDMESTNGTFVNDERIRARRLRPGDRIRIGQLEVEYRVVTRAAG